MNIKAQPMCKFAQLYACHELFLKYNTFTVILQVQGFIEIWKKEKKTSELYTHGIWWLFHLPPSEILN
jgi:hypothetical protein